MTEEFERLKLIFKRASTLPPLPISALRLIHAIDTGEASAIDLERIIVSDPPLAASILTMANLEMGHGNTTIRHAIMNIGQRSIRASAMSLTVRNITKAISLEPHVGQESFANHSLAVALISRYLFARLHKTSSEVLTTWSADELFASALLHDVTKPLLANLAAPMFDRTCSMSRRSGIGIDEAFTQIYGATLRELGAEAFHTWTLPDVFCLTQTYLGEPWKCATEVDALLCIGHADYLANTRFDYALEKWPVKREPIPEASGCFNLSSDELEQLHEHVERQIHLVQTAQAA